MRKSKGVGKTSLVLVSCLVLAVSGCTDGRVWNPKDGMQKMQLPKMPNMPKIPSFGQPTSGTASGTGSTLSQDGNTLANARAPQLQSPQVQTRGATNPNVFQPATVPPALPNTFANNGLVNQPIQIAPIQQASLTSPTFVAPQPFVQRGTKPRVALLLPTGSGGNVGSVARQMRNAALLARDDAGSLIDLNFYDSQSNGSTAAQATERALNEGAELILGPLLSTNVSRVAAQANSRGVNVIGFSNDMTQARPGAYLMGIAPDLAVQQVVSFAAQRGIRRIAVLAPKSSYGTRALSAAQDVAFQTGVQIVGPFSYDPSSGSDERKIAAKDLADLSNQFDAILIADNAQSSREMAALLVFNQVDLANKRVLGTNLWADPVVQQEVGLRGAWFAAAPEQNFKAFQSRYSQRFGEVPQKIAGIAYDAATLASTLVRQNQGFDTHFISSPSGFNGLFGSYRLSPTGHPIRAMDIREIRAGGTTVLQPASGFAGFGS
ncbi:MAG: penicillin-binding protein activator [Alphaproteobacteria bacterium]